jgi:hypothetical protein
VAARKKSTKKAAKSATDNIRLKLVTISNTFNVVLNSPPPPSTGTVAFQDDFSSGAYNSARWIIVTDPQSLNPDCGFYHGSFRSRHRQIESTAGRDDGHCEIRVRNSNFDVRPLVRGMEFWFGYRVRLEPHPTNTANGGWPAKNFNHLFYQLHKGSATDATATQPPLGFGTNNGDWILERKASDDGTNARKQSTVFRLGSYSNDIGRDIDVVIHMVLDWDRNTTIGLTELWMDGALKVSSIGANYYQGSHTGMMKIGIYASQRQFNADAQRTAYVDRVRVSEINNGSFNLVNPANWGQ